MNTRVRKGLLGLILLFSWVAVAAGEGMAGEPSRVVILPFEINADRDLSFLREGIVDMLSSRLSWENRVVVVPEEETNQVIKGVSLPPSEGVARDIGSRLQASHVLFGSITIFGNSVSVDGKMVDVHEKRPTLTFFKQSTEMDEVIPQVDLFASEINEKVFGRQVARREQVAQPPERPGIYAHPETLLAGEAAGQARAAEGAAAAGGFAAVGSVAPAAMTAEGFWKSQNLKTFIKGMALGDVDGDGRTEVVFISEDHIYVHRFENQHLLKIWEKGSKRYQIFTAVDVADVNGNGRAELFVTSLEGTGGRLGSFVLEWDGDDFKEVSKDGPWYYRVIDVPDQGPVLLGQKRKQDELFVPGVYQLAWRNGEYVPQERLALPKGTNIFGFTLGDVMNNGEQMIVAFDETDHLCIFSRSGEQQWKSEERYGGSMNYLEFEMHLGGARGDVGCFYLPQRIFVRDLNNDGQNEVIVCNNKGSIGRLFARVRKFSNGHMTSLAWNRFELTPNLRTPTVSGHISDYGIGDFDHDGRDEVVVAAVTKKGTMITNARSSIIGYELPQPSPARQ